MSVSGVGPTDHNYRLDRLKEEMENEDIAEQAELSYAAHLTFERVRNDLEGEVDGFRIGKPVLSTPPVSAGGTPQDHLVHQQASADGQAVQFAVAVAQSDSSNQTEGVRIATQGLSHLEMLKLLLAESPEDEEKKKELEEAVLALQSGNPTPAEAYLESVGKLPATDAAQQLVVSVQEVARDTQISHDLARTTEDEIQRNSKV
ncbi:hypothetical protein [Spongorhabdus nitratireducens]